ncbi:MAG TPA: hypothetical protein VGO91_10350 [Pyrinomonadaceae bacterium]|nr:hypothetical protein [Pyrinomonadaceae bacterium]
MIDEDNSREVTQPAEHFSADIIQRYDRRSLSPEEFLTVQAHLAQCANCRERLGETVGAQDAFRALRAGLMPEPPAELEHLSYEQLAAHVDEQLDEVESEITVSHMAICAECEADARDLRRYRASTEKASEGNVSAERKTLWQRFFSFDFSPAYRALFPTGAAAALAVVVLLVLWLAVHRPARTDDVGGSQARVEQVRESGGGRPASSPVETPTSSHVETQASNAQGVARIPENDKASLAASAGGGLPLRRREQPASKETPSASSMVALALSDGEERVSLDGEGHLHGLESVSPAVRQTVEESLQTRRVMRPRGLEHLAGSDYVLMGGSESAENGLPFALVGPVGMIVRSDRPTFRWRPLEGAQAYTVAVVGSGFKVVARSEKLTATEWTPPATLPRGATYYWQVTALKDGAEIVSPVSPAPLARFKVLDQNTADELASVEKASPDSHLVRGVTYAKAGLMKEAEQELTALMKANPRSTVARRLLQSVRQR